MYLMGRQGGDVSDMGMNEISLDAFLAFLPDILILILHSPPLSLVLAGESIEPFFLCS